MNKISYALKKELTEDLLEFKKLSSQEESAISFKKYLKKRTQSRQSNINNLRKTVIQ